MPKRPPSPRELRKAARERFLNARKAEGAYQRELADVSRQVGSIVRGYAPGGEVIDLAALRTTLLRYSEIIGPWARTVTAKMHESVSRRDLSSWIELGRTMGRELRKQIQTAPVGRAMREAMHLQVRLITSLPLDAAERVHKLTTEALINSTRAEQIAKEIMATGHVTLGRAKEIARTEVSRTGAILMESRARHIGSEGYIWHTSHDSDVRPLHRMHDGKYFKWNEPPIADPSGIRAHPGCIWNCRCWAEPTIPD